MSAPLENLVQRLDARRSGKGWIAKCPAHDDRKPSLSIDEGTDGRALIKCHAGCSTDDVISALGLTRRDLFPALHQSFGGPPDHRFEFQKGHQLFIRSHDEALSVAAMCDGNEDWGQVRLQSQRAFGRVRAFSLRSGFKNFSPSCRKRRPPACAPQISLPHRCFPRHEIIKCSSSLIRNKFDNICIVDEAEKRNVVRNQVEWVH